MTKQWTKQVLALSLILAACVSLTTGCTVQREEVTREPMPQEEAATAEQMEREAADEEGVGPMEQPVAGERAAGVPADLQNLQPGRQESYYRQQFEQLGYQVEDMDEQTDRVIYHLSKANQRYEVTLMRPQGQEEVQRITVNPGMQNTTGTGS